MDLHNFHKGTVRPTKTINDMELTPSYCVVCSNNIHSQLQGNEQAFTLFEFFINPSHEDSVQIVYYEGFMQNTFCIISPMVACFA